MRLLTISIDKNFGLFCGDTAVSGLARRARSRSKPEPQRAVTDSDQGSRGLVCSG